MPDVKEMLAAEGATGRPGTPEDLGNLIKTDLVRWSKLIKDNNDGTFDVTLYVRKSPYSRPEPVTKTAAEAIRTPQFLADRQAFADVAAAGRQVHIEA